VDYRYSDSFIFGATAGYARFNSDVDASHGHMNTRGWSLSAYSTLFHQDSWYVDGVLTWGHNSYDINRRILYTLTTPGGTTTVDTRATANTSGSNLAGTLTVGRDFQKGAWSIGPYFRGNLARLSFDTYRESLPAGAPGSGLGLEVKSRDVQSASSVLGGKFTYASSHSWGVLLPHVQVEWEHEFKSDPYRLEGRFRSDPTSTPILVTGDPIDNDFFRLGFGLSFIFTGGKSGFVYYEKTLGREGITQDNIALGIRIEF
jgi:outer membrane autotransporter protein